MSRIVAVAPVLAPHRHAQAEVTAMVREMVLPDGVADASARGRLLDSLHAHSGIEHRHMALPLEDYPRLGGFTEANDAFLRVGTDMAIEAVTTALKTSGLTPSDVDVVFSTTITGLAAPSLEARLVGPLGLRPDVKRVPIFGLGCVAGAAGIARVHDHLVGHPDDVAVLLSVELCSLTLQRHDTSTANLVASGLFGDGAAAVVMVGERRAAELAARGTTGPDVMATRSRFYPDTAGIMGWDVGGTGFKIVLGASVADVVARHLGADVDAFLADASADAGAGSSGDGGAGDVHAGDVRAGGAGPGASDGTGLVRDDVGEWLVHPGGPKVLGAVQEALGLEEQDLHRSHGQLADTGNLSSAAVLHVLDRAMTDTGPDAPAPGTRAVMMAMGPGFCAELVLLRWPSPDASARRAGTA